jgi:hypothetical protein
MAKANPGENFTVLRAVLPGGWPVMNALSLVMYELLRLHLHGRPGVVGGAPVGGERQRRHAKGDPHSSQSHLHPATDPLLPRQTGSLCRLAGWRAPLAAARGLLCMLLLSMLAAGGSAQPAPGPGEGAIAVEAGADAQRTSRFQAAAV